jgi:hypothetical protein
MSFFFSVQHDYNGDQHKIHYSSVNTLYHFQPQQEYDAVVKNKASQI